VVLGAALAAGCREALPSTGDETAERFAGVRKQPASRATPQSTFCEKSYPPGGEGARRWVGPPQRPLPGAADGTTGTGATTAAAWTWVNLWATWCAPCVEEMELLGRWREGFSRDGMQVRFELLSIDDPEHEKDLAAWRSKPVPGPIRWIRSEGDLGPLLESLGIDRGAMIPIHALVDASGWLRCVRVGAVHEQDYAAVKGVLAR
jgi:thiol-disulfide isomerase/thioredoxin